jgi:Helix-turn-helix domain
MTHPHGGPRRGPFSLPAWSHHVPAGASPRAAPAADPSAFVADTDDPAAGSRATALPRLLSIGDVAALFNRSARTLRRWIRAGHLVPVRVGGALFFDPGDIRRLIAGRLCAAVLAR